MSAAELPWRNAGSYLELSGNTILSDAATRYTNAKNYLLLLIAFIEHFLCRVLSLSTIIVPYFHLLGWGNGNSILNAAVTAESEVSIGLDILSYLIHSIPPKIHIRWI
jgi:hypothetical protein